MQAINCPNCGAPADDANSKSCAYCKSPFVLVAAKSLSGFSDQVLGKYSDLYKKVTRDDPDYLQCQISLTLVYLKRKLYPLADSVTKKLIEDFPDQPDAYLWKALSMMKNGEIRKLKLTSAKEITSLLQVGFSLASEEIKRDFYILAKKLESNYFAHNGISIPIEIIGITSEVLTDHEDSLINQVLET